MRKHRLLSTNLIFLFILWAAPSLYAGAMGPKMVVETPDFDFGTVDEGAVVEHTFNVLNQGDQALQILSVQPG
ncbi:MAG: hypothetical protein U5R49_20470 [Deltaproteobacteria bacterium]|nr:hypothetical protein [Deltaproteobacteria bacterium]